MSLLVDTGEVQEAHDAALLFAQGADAVAPYLMWHVVYARGHDEQSEELVRLRNVLDMGLQRIMSKMGITTLDGYRDAQLFEAVGIDTAITSYYLGGTASFVGGIGLREIYDDIARRADEGRPLPKRSAAKGVYRKEVYTALQEVARGEDSGVYAHFVEELERTPTTYLRDLLRLPDAAAPVPLREVASEEEIIAALFRGAALSLGALNPWAHRAIATAFNSFGAASNCGEGDEESTRDRGGVSE